MSQSPFSFKDKLATTGPHKLLALDGGGIRGVITLVTQVEPAHVQQMDSVEHIPAMREVGRAVARQKVNAAHFL